MNSRSKTAKPATKAPSDAGKVILREEPGKTHERIFAEVAAAGTLDNAHVMQTFAQPTMGKLRLTECVNALRDKTHAVHRGDLSSVEAMLIEQATALSTIFAELSRRSARNMGEYLDAADRYMRLALKAQSQCRATLETLATVKAGPVVIARQANIAHGPQQVNNGTEPDKTRARAGKDESAKTELLTSRAGSQSIDRADVAMHSRPLAGGE